MFFVIFYQNMQVLEIPADPTPTPRAPAASAIGAVMSLRPEAAMTGMLTAREIA